MKSNNLVRNAVVLLITVALCVALGVDLMKQHVETPIVVGENVTEVRKLSDWNPALKGTSFDSTVFVLKGEEEGANFLLLGGTHESEVSGSMNAIAFVENAQVKKGTFYIIPYANNSGITHTAALEGMLDEFTLTLSDGSTRTFRVGNRYANPVDQWPDPNYYMGSSGRELTNSSVSEIRNLNRNYPANNPGEAEGYGTLRACYGIYNLIQTEGIDFLYDAHEGNIAFPRVDYMIAHNDAMMLASTCSLNMMMEGLTLGVDQSGATSWGLSHRALGDNTDALCTLVEVLSPFGAMHGKYDENLLIEGDDEVLLSDVASRYATAAGGTPATKETARLVHRTAYQMAVTYSLINAYTELYPENSIIVEGIPTYNEIIEMGLGNLFKPLS